MGSISIVDLDAVVVGAGVAGIYSTYCLRERGLSVKCIDMAGGVGGTWYWNRYPGAMSDTESYLYRYSWDKSDLQTYPWSHHYVYQPEILQYLDHIVEKHDLRKYMELSTEMEDASWDDDDKRWRITTNRGTIYRCRYLINCLGLLSKANYPDIPGIESFAGTRLHTATWTPNIDLSGKTVGIIGNGSTGVQVITALAPIVKHLTTFQRHPQYSVPSGQGPVSPEYRESVNARYDEIWDGVFKSAVGFGVPESDRPTMSVSAEERKQIFQSLWDQGNGFRFMFSGFGDITTNEEANEEACKFIRSKIDEIVKDPKKAQALKPRDAYARRPLCDTGYYQTFNRDNVEIVDLRETQIESIVPAGIRTTDGKTHEFDTLIFATGFDAIDGSYMRIKIHGRTGSIKDHWSNGAKAFAGVTCHGFPNMFLISGPQGPFANFPPVIESEIGVSMSCIDYAEANIEAQNGKPTIMEISEEAENEWGALCDQLADSSLFKKTSSWVFGTNVKGGKSSTKFYFGGLAKYREFGRNLAASGFTDFQQG